MTTLERVMWGAAGTIAALAIAVDWWRFEQLIRREQRTHRAEMAAITAISQTDQNGDPR